MASHDVSYFANLPKLSFVKYVYIQIGDGVLTLRRKSDVIEKKKKIKLNTHRI